jgi:hypothetical protein
MAREDTCPEKVSLRASDRLHGEGEFDFSTRRMKFYYGTKFSLVGDPMEENSIY